MSGESPGHFFDEEDVRERVDRYLAGPHTLDHAAICGLLALAVPSEFGGAEKEENILIRNLYPRSKTRKTWELFNPVWTHLRTCQVIMKYGTLAERGKYLPQLAAGERYGVLTLLRGDSSSHSSIRADRYGDGYSLRGNTVAMYRFAPQSYVMFAALLNRQIREFIVDGATLPEGKLSKRGRVLLELRDFIVPTPALLGEPKPPYNVE